MLNKQDRTAGATTAPRAGSVRLSLREELADGKLQKDSDNITAQTITRLFFSSIDPASDREANFQGGNANKDCQQFIKRERLATFDESWLRQIQEAYLWQKATCAKQKGMYHFISLS